jgi:anaerobic magnesium-protoporphyrin IX monomethyl ester cyclase
MKILLINPAFFDEWEFKNRYHDFLDWVKGGNLYVAPFEPPLGLAYLAAYLKGKGHRVELLDMQGLLMDSNELIRIIAEKNPDLIGVTAMTTTFPAALKVAGLARQVAPVSKIVFGGVHPTLDPAGVLAHDCVDYVIRGEGEKALNGLIDAINQQGSFEEVAGLCYRDGNQVIIKEKMIIEDQDSIPMPDYDAFPVERYIKHNEYLRGIRGISMLISRGCPFPCTFCAVHQTMGRKWRVKSPHLVVDEVLTARDRYNLEGIWFKDSIFNLNPVWTKQFSKLMIEREAGIVWQANTRIDLIDEEELKLMKAAGLVQLDLGIETGSKRSLEKLQKKITVEQIKEKVKLAQKYVKVFGFFMIGIPGEEETDVRETFELAKELELDRSTWSIYSPLPGSTLYDELVTKGNLKPYDLNFEEIHFTKAYEGICNIEPGRLSELYHEINDYFYKNPTVQSAV